MQRTYIYALCCPVEKKIKYIGKSNNPKSRFRKHKQMSDKNHQKNEWIKSLLEIGLEPILEIVEKVPIDTWKEKEKLYIKKYSNSILNVCGGGNGLSFGNQTSFRGKPPVSVICFDKNGNVVEKFQSIKDAEEFSNCGIYNVLIGKRKSAGGYLWLYENKYLNMSEDEFERFVSESNINRSIENGVHTRFKKNQKPKNCQKIDQFDLNENYIRSWNDSVEASLFYTGKRRSGINNCVRGKCKSSLGYIWKLST